MPQKLGRFSDRGAQSLRTQDDQQFVQVKRLLEQSNLADSIFKEEKIHEASL